MPDTQGSGTAAAKPTAAKVAEPTQADLKAWAFNVGKLVEDRGAATYTNQNDPNGLSDCMSYVVANLKDMSQELQKYAVQDNDWRFWNMVGKFRTIMKSAVLTSGATSTEKEKSLAVELKKVQAAYKKMRADLTEEASYSIPTDKERRKRLQRILDGKEVQHPDDLRDLDEE